MMARVVMGSDDERADFLREFTAAVGNDLADLAARRGLVAQQPVLSGDDVVYAETTVTFQGRRFSYRQRVWPSEHHARFQAGLYATFLEERLLTRPAPADGSDDVIPL